MKRYFLLTILIILFGQIVFAIDVDENELKTVSRGSVEFINYTGPYDRIDTRQEIINIGVKMGRAIAAGRKKSGTRYIAIHLPGSAGEKIGADIIILAATAGVDHVRNLRYILAGYIMTVYDYSFDQSLLLAEFITIYNAVYRRNMEKFGNRYTDAVVGELDPVKAGLSTRYNEWPGNTQIVIPLSSGAEDGGFGSVGSGDLTDKEVLGEMRGQDDMGVDSRKDMVDLQEEELQNKEKDLLEDKQDVQKDREQLEQDKQQNEEDQQQIDEQDKQLEQDKQALDEKQQEIDQMDDGPEKEAAQDQLDKEKETVAEKEKQLEQDKQDLADRRNETDQREKDVQNKEKEVDDRQDTLQKEQENLQQEREQVAKDEKTLEVQGRSAKQPEFALFLKADESNSSKSGQLVIVDLSSGVIDKTSGLTNLRNRMFQLVNKTVVGISGTGNNANLVLFDMETLSLIRRSDVTVYENTYLAYTDGVLYAVVKDGSSWHIGKFDKALNFVSRSDGDVDKYTAIVVSDGKIIAQRPDGQIRILTKESFIKAE